MPLPIMTPETLDKHLEIAVCRLANDLRFGQDVSPYAGAGIDYLQSRPFEQGDSVRDIDWKVTARTQRFHVKQYEALRSVPLYLVVDTSASMAVSSRALSKHKLAVLLAGGLGLAALRRLSPVGVLGAGRRQLHVQPSLQRGRIFQWLHALDRAGQEESTHLAERLDWLTEMLGSRTLVIVISDLHDPDGISSVKRLAQQHDVLVLHLQDPAERGALQAGFVHAVEAETGRAFVGHTRSRWRVEDDRDPRRQFAAAGVDYLLLRTDLPFIVPLRRMLSDRGGVARNTR
jgi:uncharacterized protein (DUF58 family)